MTTESYGNREFRSTYFALRVGLIVAALIVLMAPASAWVFDGDRPPSISDSWYTDARMIFVIGLAAAGCLLAVVRGDTLVEQALLNIAGGLALVVAAAACWPKDASGESLKVYPADAERMNEYAIGALLVTAVMVGLATIWLPKELVGTGWNASGWWKILMEAAYPVVLVAGIAYFLLDRKQFAEHAHGPAAVSMFILLGLVALLRTSWGVGLLTRIGDTPVDDSVSATRLGTERPAHLRRFDTIYAGVAFGMFAVVALAVALACSHAEPGWILGVEVALLVLFMVFWGAQTREGWIDDHAPPVSG